MGNALAKWLKEGKEPGVVVNCALGLAVLSAHCWEVEEGARVGGRDVGGGGVRGKGGSGMAAGLVGLVEQTSNVAGDGELEERDEVVDSGDGGDGGAGGGSGSLFVEAERIKKALDRSGSAGDGDRGGEEGHRKSRRHDNRKRGRIGAAASSVTESMDPEDISREYEFLNTSIVRP